VRRSGSLIPARRPPEPRAAEARYLRWSKGVMHLWAGLVQGFADKPVAPTREEVARAWRDLLHVSGLTGVLSLVSREIEKSNATYFRSVLKTNPPRPDPAYARAAWVSENVALWNKLGDELVERLLETLRAPRVDAKASVTRAVNAARKANVGLVSGLDVKQTLSLGKLLKAGQEQGVRHETLIESVQAITGYGESRARLIARDQTVKHNAAVLEAQARAAGVTRYRWVTVKDEATRPMHKALDGQTFSFSDPPVTNKQGDRNNPGGDYQCRCSAMVVIDLFAGLSDE
jgi:SPP1 gp7 family putative phage head morphogenesis protein